MCGRVLNPESNQGDRMVLNLLCVRRARRRANANDEPEPWETRPDTLLPRVLKAAGTEQEVFV